LTTNVTSVCQWLARPCSLSTGQDGRRALDGRHGRVRRGQRPEVTGEPLLALVIEVNAVEHQDLVLVEGGADRADRRGIELAVDVEVAHLAPMRPVILRGHLRAQRRIARGTVEGP
jgi:hypothetical protein